MSSMFWGLCMKPNRKYTQTIVKSFHISGVAIDDGEAAKLYITADKTKFTVASLSKAVPQFALDLNFCKGDKIMFQTTGDATVSLIGYLHDADDSDDEDFEDEQYEAIAKSLGKKKGQATGENDSDVSDEEDDDEDDDKLAAEYSSFLDAEESGEEEEDDDESDEEGEEDDESEEEEESPKAKKAKINENAKKSAKELNGAAKNEQKQQQQPKSKKEKKAAAQAEVKKEQPKAKEVKQQTGERTIAGGVKVQDLQAGNGPEAKQGKRVSVYYIGRLKSNNKSFDSMQKGNGFKFGLGAGEVIKGWDVGVAGMKVGGKRRITCPPHMAYGARGHPPTIPPNSTLVFDVELKAVH